MSTINNSIRSVAALVAFVSGMQDNCEAARTRLDDDIAALRKQLALLEKEHQTLEEQNKKSKEKLSKRQARLQKQTARLQATDAPIVGLREADAQIVGLHATDAQIVGLRSRQTARLHATDAPTARLLSEQTEIRDQRVERLLHREQILGTLGGAMAFFSIRDPAIREERLQLLSSIANNASLFTIPEERTYTSQTDPQGFADTYGVRSTCWPTILALFWRLTQHCTLDEFRRFPPLPAALSFSDWRNIPLLADSPFFKGTEMPLLQCMLEQSIAPDVMTCVRLPSGAAVVGDTMSGFMFSLLAELALQRCLEPHCNATARILQAITFGRGLLPPADVKKIPLMFELAGLEEVRTLSSSRFGAVRLVRRRTEDTTSAFLLQNTIMVET